MGFQYEIEEEYDNDVKEGEVLRQDPKYQEGYKVKKNKTIKLTISKGPRKAKLPKDFKDQNIEEVKKEMDETEFKYEVEEVFDEKIEKGKVIKMEPEYKKDEELPLNTIVKFTVSKGSSIQKVKVPKVIGKKKEEALKILEEAKLVGRVNEIFDPGKENNEVLYASVKEGEEAKEGTEIYLEVNTIPAIKNGILDINLAKILGDDAKKGKKVELIVRVNNEQQYREDIDSGNKNISVPITAREGRTEIQVLIDGSVKALADINLKEKANWSIPKE